MTIDQSEVGVEWGWPLPREWLGMGLYGFLFSVDNRFNELRVKLGEPDEGHPCLPSPVTIFTPLSRFSVLTSTLSAFKFRSDIEVSG